MSNETKRDVFDELLEIAGNAMDQAMSAQYPSDENGCAPGSIGKAIRDILDPIEKRYDAASPCKLSVIPQAVGEYIKWGKTYGIPTYMMFSFKFVRSQGFSKLTDEVEDWIISNSDVFVMAWLLGVWRVEEIGEIVKVEEEHD
ncbi:hypothetical protein [Lacticaseibacillus paracasei]|uniref:Phage protein n=2 Tax=Lacticaseibacillus paracasei TaxID=1597 RepID=S2RKV3_LACPA|nr:hypothetical protein [Lacticaseibacillus paracasei]EPC67933.1 hypothetical protein Lpp126_18872 [Lacticaseibacillus paracasei subsp. paracasei Lpp126]QOP56118.1 hypothetical protein HCJ88_10215 [Lacticaseibacillus paracasei]